MLIYLLAVLIERLTLVVVPIAIAFLLVGVVGPVVDRLRPIRGPEWLAPLTAVLLLLAITVGIFAGLAARLAQQIPELRDEFETSLVDLEERLSIDLPELPGSGGTDSSSDVSAERATEIVAVGSDVLVVLFLLLALTFLFLKDGNRLWSSLLSLAPEAHRDRADNAGRAAFATAGTYVRGLTVVALFDAVGVGLGLLALGVPLVLTLAVVQFLASYVPTIGAFVAGGVAVTVALGANGVTSAALTFAVVVLVQEIGNHVIEPWIMGHTLPVHPVAVLVAVTAGAILWGVAGALLFVPLMAAGTAAARVLRADG